MKRMIKCSSPVHRISESWKNRMYLDEETSLQSNHTIKGYGRVDNIYIQYERGYDRFPRLAGYAHGSDSDTYTYEYLTVDMITNYDLHPFMDGEYIMDLEGMLKKYPQIVYDEEYGRRNQYIESILKSQKNYKFTREELEILPMKSLEDLYMNA